MLFGIDAAVQSTIHIPRYDKFLDSLEYAIDGQACLVGLGAFVLRAV